MAAGLMTGCGSKPAETNATTAAPQAAETEKTEAPETTKAQNTAEKEPVELTIWLTSRNKDDWYVQMEDQFLEEHPWITLNKVVKEGIPATNSIRP